MPRLPDEQPVAGPSNPTVLRRRRTAAALRRRATPTPSPSPTPAAVAPRDTPTLPSALPVPFAAPHSLSPGIIVILVLCGLAATLLVAVTLFSCHRLSRRRKGMRPAQGTQRSVLADELRTWASKVSVVAFHRPPDTDGEPKPARPASPIHPGLLHTPSRPSSFILDISAKADPELDPWAAARVRSVEPADPEADPWAAARVRAVEDTPRTSEQPWAAVPLPLSPASSTPPAFPPGVEPGAFAPRPAAGLDARAPPPALSVRTSMLARPQGPRSPASPRSHSPGSPSPGGSSSLPDLGYGPGSAFGGGGSGSQHAPSVRLGTVVGTGGSRVSGVPYGAYDTHERPEWMPALPPAALYPERARPALDEPAPARLSPIMWARPEAYRGAK